MFNQSSEEFFNENVEEGDFQPDFFLQPENLQLPSLPLNEPTNHYNLFLENDHFSMDISAVKNLKSQIINSDLLIESNERLKKKVQELEIENKELKLMNVRAKDQEQKRFTILENKLKSAEMMSSQFKEQLHLQSTKEVNPQINIAMRDKLKTYEKTLKLREDEIRRRDDEMRQKDIMIENLRGNLSLKEQELKTLRDQTLGNWNYLHKKEGEDFKMKKLVFGVRKRLRKLKCMVVRKEKGAKESMEGKKEEIKEELENYKREMSKMRELQEETLNEKLESFKKEFSKQLPMKVLEIFQGSNVKNTKMELFPTINDKIEVEAEEPIIKNEPNNAAILDKSNSSEFKFASNSGKDNENENTLKEGSFENPEKTTSKSEEDRMDPLKKGTKKKLRLQETLKINDYHNENISPEKMPLDLPTKLAEKEMEGSIKGNGYESDSKIRKVSKKNALSIKEFEDLLAQNPSQSKDLLKVFFPFYFKRTFLQTKSSNESFLKYVFSIISQISTVITTQNLLEILQEASSSYEPFEVGLSFEEFLMDLSQNTEETAFMKLLEAMKDILKTTYIIQWKWKVKTRNQKYLNEEKKSLFIEFFKKSGSSNYFENILNENSDDPYEKEHKFKMLQNMSPVSFQLNNDFLDLISLTMLKWYRKKGRIQETTNFLYDIITQKFYLPRAETILNLIYSIILQIPQAFQVAENRNVEKTYDLHWILQIGTNSQMMSPICGPLALQAMRLTIVDICHHWKILSRSSQNIFLHNEFQRKTLFILLRLHELLENEQSTDILFGLFNYETIKEIFQENLFEKKRWGGLQNMQTLQPTAIKIGLNKSMSSCPEDWPWFRNINLDPLSLSSLLTNNLINILEKSLFYWDGLIVNYAVDLKGILDMNDIMATIGVYMGHQQFYMTGLLQKSLLGFIYNKKYDQTFQRTFSLLTLSMMSKNIASDKDLGDLLWAILQDRVPNIRVGQMDKVACLFCLWKKLNVSLKELLEQNRLFINPFIFETMNYLAFNKTTH